MIHRIVIELIIVIVLSDLYIDMHYFHKHYHIKRWQRVLWWAPCVMMIVYTCALASIENFAPADLTWLNLYMLLLGLFVGPKAVFTVFSSVGWVLRKTIIPTHRNYGHYLGLLAGLIAVGAYIYGLTIGVGQIRVSHVDISFPTCHSSSTATASSTSPTYTSARFDGWRKKILVDEMDSIRAQRADIISSAGDLQNMRPQEGCRHGASAHHSHGRPQDSSPLGPRQSRLCRIRQAHATNRGEHAARAHRHREQPATLARPQQRASGGAEATALRGALAEHSGAVASVRQPADSIVFVGTENDGRPPFPQRADWPKAFRHLRQRVRHCSPARSVGMGAGNTAQDQRSADTQRTHPRRTMPDSRPPADTADAA